MPVSKPKSVEEPVTRNAEYVGLLETPFDDPEEDYGDGDRDGEEEDVGPPEDLDLLHSLPPPGRVDGRTNAGKKIASVRAREGLAPDGHPHTPQPPGKTFTYDAAKPERNTTRWFEYMRDLCTNHRYALPRITIYIYRKWPVVDLPHGSRSVKVMGEDWDMFSSDDVMRRYGSGMYRIMVNDQLVKQTDNKTNTVCNAMVDCRDLDNFPPIIENMATAVNWADPANKSYIEYLVRSRVQVKGSGVPALETIPSGGGGYSNNEESEEESMAVVEKMFDAVMAQNERMMEKAEKEPAPVVVPVAAPTSDAIAPLTSAFVELVKNQSSQGLRMSDVMEVLRTVHPPQQDNMAPVIDMLTKQMMAAQEQNNKLMLMLLTPKVEPAQAAPVANATPKDALADALNIGKTLRGVVAEYMEESGGGAGAAVNPTLDWKTALINALAGNLPAVLGLLTRLTAMAPQPPQQVAQPQPYPYPYPNTLPSPQQAAQPQQAPPPPPPPTWGPPPPPPPAPNVIQMPQPQPQPQTQNQTTLGGQDPMFMRAVIMQAMDQFGPVILRNLMGGVHGADFAEEVRRDAGENEYRMIAGMGVDGVMGILREHPSTAGAVAADPVAVQEFVDQFCHPEKYPDEGDGTAGGKEEASAAAAPAAAAVVPPLPAS